MRVRAWPSSGRRVLVLAVLLVLAQLGFAYPASAETSASAWDDAFSQRANPSLWSFGTVRAIIVDPRTGAVTVGEDASGPQPADEVRRGVIRFAADGTPDAAFNDAFGVLNPALALALDDTTGAITVGGRFTSAGWPTLLARLNADGTRTGFTGGVDLPGTVHALALDPATGALTIGGDFTSPGRYLARYRADGSPDTAFNAAVGSTLTGTVRALALTPSGGVTVGGDAVAPGGLARFDADGTLDTSFVGGLDGTVRAMASSPDGSLTVGGDFSTPNPSLARYTPDGTPDTAFEAAAGPLEGGVTALAVDPDTGAVTVGGDFTSPGQRLARFTATGQPDTAFNTGPAGTTLTAPVLSMGLAGPVLVVGGLGWVRRLVTVTVALSPPDDQVGLLGTAVDPVTLAATTTGDPVTYAATGLPPGLAVDPATGQITGTPTVAGTYAVTVRATSSGVTDTAAFTWRIDVPPTIAGDPPDGAVGVAYDYTFALDGDPAPTAAVTGGALPPGLTLDPDGRLHGTPTAGGDHAFDVTATGAGGATATLGVTITVTAPPTITGDPPDALAGAPYDWSFDVGGHPAPVVTVSGGALPPGLVLDPDGRLHGTPTTAGVFELDVTATAADQQEQHLAVTLTVVGPAIAVTRDPVTAGTQQIVAGTGFVPGEAVTLVLTSDPVALGTATADDAGQITRTFTVPTSTATGTHTVTATSRGGTSTATFAVTVAPPAGGGCGDPGSEPGGGSAGGSGGGTGSSPDGSGAPCGGGGQASGRLPTTGADAAPLALLGMAFLAAGTALVRRRGLVAARRVR